MPRVILSVILEPDKEAVVPRVFVQEGISGGYSRDFYRGGHCVVIRDNRGKLISAYPYEEKQSLFYYATIFAQAIAEEISRISGLSVKVEEFQGLRQDNKQSPSQLEKSAQTASSQTSPSGIEHLDRESFLARVRQAYGEKVADECQRRIPATFPANCFSIMQDVLGELNKKRVEGMGRLEDSPLGAQTPPSCTHEGSSVHTQSQAPKARVPGFPGRLMK